MSDVVGVDGSPSHPSRTRAVAALAVELAGGGELIDLAEVRTLAAALGRGAADGRRGAAAR